jgi:hypothetical protein
VYDAAGLEFDDDKDEESAEQGIVGLKEVASPDLMGVIAQEGCPSLLGRQWSADAVDVLLDGCSADPQTEFEQFALDASCAPAPVLGGHLHDECHEGLRDRRAMSLLVCIGLTFPHLAEHITMPA